MTGENERTLLEGALDAFLATLSISEVDAYMDAENDLVDMLLASCGDVAAEYHMFVESGGKVVLPCPRIGKGGTIKWT